MSGCCCCCPPAISALFCLWVQSGCSKGTVAGALTFFPPEPSLYKFERHYKGRVLRDDEAAPEPGAGSDETVKKSETQEKCSDDDDSVGTLEGPNRIGPLEETANNRTGQTQKKIKSPIQQLTDQAVERRKQSKERNVRNHRDLASGVTYKLLLDPRLQVPPHDDHAIQCVQIPTCHNPKKNSTSCSTVAAIIYRVPPERQQATTKTIIISHGNATDIGAMFPIQVVLAHSLDCNVVSYDYSGYGESGGVPDEHATYRDMAAVYDYCVENVANGIERNVILYGQSVGSGPCCHLASNTKDNHPGGMILHSAFTSGMRVLTSSRYVKQLEYLCSNCNRF
jgi:Serine aminopeptidase, S33